ncbi:MAG TPA: V-type ATPase 116kDa subunit family protein, partial [Gemmatimonadales bacterium]|nr:V-type ATPase 116kDa subunit family protein [Gemmatimonadales bacterium]
AALTALAPWLPPAGRAAPVPAGTAEFARWARLAWKVRRITDRLKTRATVLEEERALILKYQGFFSAFRPLLENEARWRNTTVYHVLLKQREKDVIPRLRSSLASLIGDSFEIYSRELAGGETALLVVVSAATAGKVERLLAEARVEEIPVPAAYGGASLAEAIPKMLSRLGELPGEIERVDRERRDLAKAHGATLRTARLAIAHRLQALNALPLSSVTAHAFVLEGWLPADARTRLAERLRSEVGESVVVTEVSREEWRSEEAPVVLRNPRLFRPFEAVISLLPLPRYGSIDPTPFVAVFFPVFFGLMLGDVGYGLILAIAGLVLHRRSKPGTMLRSVSEIIGPCALFAILAGFLFGEFFGDLGRRWFGLHPLAFDREEALIPFLLLAIAIGGVHILLGMILGVVAARRHPREAIGRGAAVLALLFIAAALLAAVDVLPRAFFTPAVIGLLVAFPVLVIVEGVVAPIEFLSTLGNILSYARIMALGVASVMLAVVANRMVGMLGSAVVGVMFALLFHLVNFAIGLFSPTIHALRLHYVEFFGKFYSPGGVRYEPFGAWSAGAGITRT